MKNYRFKLASNKVPKIDCPFCKSRRHWQRYIDAQTGEALPPQYGLCDNRLKCGQGLNPYSEKYNPGESQIIPPRPKADPITAFIPINVLKSTLTDYGKNGFVQFLLNKPDFPFEVKDLERVISMYRLGTMAGESMEGAVTFPFIDTEENIRAIQVKNFDSTNKTIATNKIDKIILSQTKKTGVPPWLIKYLEYCDSAGYYTCCFGDHLLPRFPLNPVILVEAPKTAIYGTLSFGFPDDPETPLWLSVYNLNGLTYERCKSLKGREVFLLPDLSRDGSAFRLWESRARILREQIPGTNFAVISFLEALGTANLREAGSDIADIIIGLNWRELRLRGGEFKEAAQSQKSEGSEESEGPKNKYFLDSEREARIERRVQIISNLIGLFWSHVEKFNPKDFDKYLFCWTRDLSDLISQNGITPGEFIEFVNEENGFPQSKFRINNNK